MITISKKQTYKIINTIFPRQLLIDAFIKGRQRMDVRIQMKINKFDV